MDLSFEQLKYLVTVVCDDLVNDDFGHLQTDQLNPVLVETEESKEIYDKIYLLKDLLNELYKHRPLPF